MTLNEFKTHLNSTNQIEFHLPNGSVVPQHFHITELGLNTKTFIDCGGTIRKEKKIIFQLWYANDTDHLLTPETCLGIIKKAEKHLPISNYEIEIEYQGNTKELYGLEYKNGNFSLAPTYTDCLAKEQCGITDSKEPTSCCPQTSNCC
ncbi:DUF6428 family protein [Luteibaculum oceani]|uniref:Uncharacterized protein n=1 Tax=Luteibaculum oceani TaxID=1294296 RepID=A0A5C6UVW6_9FLAO|nr:DUF6428 family protein [Luteibaculum oceani]TXC77109.1 hypothetical protein FRX97_09605 [Luteibaculum oceani]